MAKKKYQHSAQDFLDITPGAGPTKGQEDAYKRAVNSAVGIIDSNKGPMEASGNPVFPGWLRMSIQERIMAVIRTIEKDDDFKKQVGDDLLVRFEKGVKEEYAKKHRRPNP